MKTFNVRYKGKVYSASARTGFQAAGIVGKMLRLERDSYMEVHTKLGWLTYDYKGDGTAVLLRGYKLPEAK